jgi:hypothetical protein
LVCSNGMCAEPMKRCFQNCSGHGDCTSRDTRTYTMLMTCSRSDIYCEAQCICEPGFAGKACELTSDEFSSRQNMRIKLLNGLRNTTLSEDNSERNVITWIELLSAMSQQIEELSVDAIVVMLDTCEYILKITQDDGVALEYEEFLKLLDPLNVISHAIDNLETLAQEDLELKYTGTDVRTLIRVVSDRISSDMVTGQETPSYVSSNLRLLVTKPDLFESKKVKLGVPLTENEIYSVVVPSYCEMDLNSSGTFSLVSRNAGSYNNSGFLSNPLELSASSLVCSTEPCQIIFDLQSNSEVDYGANATGSINSSLLTPFVTKCEASDIRIVNHTCASGQVIRHNCTGVAETLVTKCMPPVLVPVCRLLVNDEPVLDASLCKVLWYNSTRTRCQCTLSDAAMQTRRLVAVSDNGVVTYVRSYTVVMMAEHVGNTFADTVRTADTTNLSTFQKAVIVIVFYGVLAAIVFLSIINPLGEIETEMKKMKKKKRKKSKVDPKRQSQTIWVGGRNGLSTSEQQSTIAVEDPNTNSPKQYLASYIDSVLPAVFRIKSGVVALLHEIHHHHRYWLIFTTSPNKWHRTKVMLHIHCSWLFMLFIMALVFDLEVIYSL